MSQAAWGAVLPLVSPLLTLHLQTLLSVAWVSVWMGAKGDGVEWGWLEESSGASFTSALWLSSYACSFFASSSSLFSISFPSVYLLMH